MSLRISKDPRRPEPDTGISEVSTKPESTSAPHLKNFLGRSISMTSGTNSGVNVWSQDNKHHHEPDTREVMSRDKEVV